MHQHLVDNDLKKQRCEQGEELDEERRQQHLAQQFAVLDDGGNEPGEVEFFAAEAKPGPLGDKDKLPAPDLFEGGALQDQRPAFKRVLHQDLVAIHFGD